jgi:hypothetical protein
MRSDPSSPVMDLAWMEANVLLPRIVSTISGFHRCMQRRRRNRRHTLTNKTRLFTGISALFCPKTAVDKRVCCTRLRLSLSL